MLNLRQSTVEEGCKVVRTAARLKPKDRGIFLDAIADEETWSAYALDIELRKRGIVCSNDTIMMHRRGACKCHN